MDELRHNIRQMKSHKEDKMSLVQLGAQETSTVNQTVANSQMRALQISWKARFGELKERLHSRGVSASATHRFAASIRENCGVVQKRSEAQLKLREQQARSLSSAIEALSAAEALHGIDESSLAAAAVEAGDSDSRLSFLQVSRSTAQMPDLFSFLESTTYSESPKQDDVNGMALAFAKDDTQQHKDAALPAMPEDQRPKVFALLSKMQKEGSQFRSQKEAWCQEERSREQKSLQTARVSAMMFGNDAAKHGQLKAELSQEIDHIKNGTAEFSAAGRSVLEEAANATKALDATSRDGAVAAKVMQKAVQGLSKLREKWWGHSTANPVDAATKALARVQETFEVQAADAQGFRKESAASAKLVATRAKDLISVLQSESNKLQLARDFYAKRQQRSEGTKQLYEAEVKSATSYLQGLEQTCNKQHFDEETRSKEAQMRALHDAQMVFAGQRPQTNPIQHLRGASSQSLSPMEKAALDMGVSMDD
eukprot:TRINITY_DN77726_c0_g1_i1.p1 TRINITY_DN77726_c0_g1~~TRINITY_DN77726_c0_g1_i1.p1  ORF type:complete len:564 (-),score=153.17 TRINITY_DN77726_c0_g1_i1:41-1486(-)